jgi:hypothetical protein
MASRRCEAAAPVFLRPLPSLEGPVNAVGRISGSLSPVLLQHAPYTLVRWALIDRGPALGPDHAARLLRWESAIGLDWKRPVHAFDLRHDWLIRVANWSYVAGFLPVFVLAAAIGRRWAGSLAVTHSAAMAFAVS